MTIFRVICAIKNSKESSTRNFYVKAENGFDAAKKVIPLLEELRFGSAYDGSKQENEIASISIWETKDRFVE